MARYLLDTNIVLAYQFRPDTLDKNTAELLYDYDNQLYVSTVSIQELIHLHKREKIETDWKKPEDILPAIDATFEILPVKKEHLMTYSKLSAAKSHNDPNDHLIISQAITERITLVSMDREFRHYTKQKLSFIFSS
ncbi:putative nucleic acid-binding protein, contains PIN domain [Bacteroidales bacterium Barb6]|nr:putative nucleic acid-binding protein, contains PIN domain [Bacteroidales bacterium Barb6]